MNLAPITNRHFRLLGTAAVIIALMSGCTIPSGRKDPPDTKPAQREQITNDIHDAIFKEPGVLTAETSYSNTLDDYASGSIEVLAKPGSDLNAIYDRALELFWRSKLYPLYVVRIAVSDGHRNFGRPETKLEAVVLNPPVTTELTANYGPRPT